LGVIFQKEVGSYSLGSTMDDSIISEYKTEHVEMESVNYNQRENELTTDINHHIPGNNLVTSSSNGYSHSNWTSS